MRACRECGCTDAQGCAGGCVWVDEDLCSTETCQAAAIARHPMIQAPLGVELPMHTWLAVHGNLVLALRHPGNDGPSRTMIQDLVSLLEGVFLDTGLLTEGQVVAMHQQDEQEQAGAVQHPRIIIPGA